MTATLPENHGTPLGNLPAPVAAKTKTRTTWAEILICGIILAVTLYVVVFAFLVADALFFNRNFVIKPIQNTSQGLFDFLAVIYAPPIFLLKLFRVLPG